VSHAARASRAPPLAAAAFWPSPNPRPRLFPCSQRYIIRLLLMPIIYSIMSACALQVGLPKAIYYETGRDWCVRASGVQARACVR